MMHLSKPSIPVRGFMLIEVLVSVLLFSVGVLALVGLQANMSKTQNATKIRTDASYLANEAIGMMWGDLGNLANYNTAACAGYARCKAWSDKVRMALPSGQVAITVSPAATGTGQDISIDVTWSLPDGTHTYSTLTTIHPNT